LIRPGHRLKSWGGFSTGAIGTTTSADAEWVEAKVDEKVACDSILEALGCTGGDRCSVVRAAGGGINTVGTGGDAARDSADDDGVDSVVLHAGAGVLLASNAMGGILTSAGADATR
jgi:hypothetical protein